MDSRTFPHSTPAVRFRDRLSRGRYRRPPGVGVRAGAGDLNPEPRTLNPFGRVATVPRLGHLVVLSILLAGVAAAGGCASALATAVWLVKGPNISAEYDGLRSKRVVVVCRPLTSSLYANPGVAKDISRQISLLLKRNVSKIEVVDQQKVAEWIDSNTWDDYLEVGKALEADLVVGVDLEEFSLYQSQTLYQGKANLSVHVYDCATGELVFERYPPQTVYPPNHVVSTSDVQESDFRREFIGVLSDEIARHFYPHDPRAYWAMDSAVIH